MAKTAVRMTNNVASANTVAVVAMVVIGMLIFAALATFALLVYAGMRYSMYRADAEASLALIRHQLRMDLARAQSAGDVPTQDALQASLDDVSDGVSPRVALAMRRLNRAPMIGGARPVGHGVPRPHVSWTTR